jgi:hypothetical protein
VKTQGAGHSVSFSQDLILSESRPVRRPEMRDRGGYNRV